MSTLNEDDIDRQIREAEMQLQSMAGGGSDATGQIDDAVRWIVTAFVFLATDE